VGTVAAFVDSILKTVKKEFAGFALRLLCLIGITFILAYFLGSVKGLEIKGYWLALLCG